MIKADKKRLKHLINVRFLMKVNSREERKTIFGKPRLFLSLWYFNLHVSDV